MERNERKKEMLLGACGPSSEKMVEMKNEFGEEVIDFLESFSSRKRIFVLVNLKVKVGDFSIHRIEGVVFEAPGVSECGERLVEVF